MGGLVRAVRARLDASPRWAVLRRAVQASPRLSTLVVGVVVVASLLPTAFSLTTGALVGALPAAVAAGWGSPASRVVAGAVVLLGALFVAQQTLGALTMPVTDALGRRVMGGHHRAVMRAALRPPTVAHLEDPRFLDQIERAVNYSASGPRNATQTLMDEARNWLRGLAALAVLAHFRCWLALGLLVAFVVYTRRLQAAHRALVSVGFKRTQWVRRAQYLNGLLVLPAAAKEVRVFGLARWLVDRLRRTWHSALAETWHHHHAITGGLVPATLPILAAQAVALGLIVLAAARDEIGLGALVVYAQAVLGSEALATLASGRVEHGGSGFRPLRELERAVEREPALVLPGARPAAGLPREAIRFEGVAFRYPDRATRVFDALDLTIPAGQSLAIVGDNGAGKTTLVKLLARLYDPHGGRITVDGTDLRELDARGWQRRIAAIFQDFVQYQLPAYDNVAFGAVERFGDRAAVEGAARRAGTLAAIEGLPRGWDTVLSRQYAGGADLSGGQWQRVALARALFAAGAGAGVLILDEPTAHLDVRAEAAFFDAFLDLTRGLTTVVISHRFSTVRRAHRIAVLARGRVVEEGSHEALVRLGGRYATMFDLQASRFVGPP
jgi:ABC-type multidrug transport system fused ATPase/permease subunit